MIPNCSSDITDVYSPQLRQQQADEPPPRATVSVDDGFFFHCALYRLHYAVAQRARKIPWFVWLALEVLLLLALFLQLGALVCLHSLLMPSPLSPAPGPLAGALTRALPAQDGPVELLRIEARHGRLPPVRCEFAAERAALEMPRRVRERAYASSSPSSRVMSLTLNGTLLLGNSSFLSAPWLAPAVLSRRILGEIVRGPLFEEVRSREPVAEGNASAANGSGENGSGNASGANASDAGRGASSAGAGNSSLVAGGKPSGGVHAAPRWQAGSNWSGWGIPPAPQVGSSLLAYVSCNGQEPASLHPLRRSAELLRKQAEWWLFKAVWALSTALIVILAGGTTSLCVRSSLLGLFRLRHGSKGTAAQRLETLEVLVLVFSPGAVILALCRAAGDTTGGLTAVLFSLSVAEVAALCALRTRESRYIFPRAALPVYVADMYYAFFHPFGFTFLAHSALYTFQTFLLCTLWGHFEAPARLPDASRDHLSVEVRMRPCEQPNRIQALSPPVQRLLLEQGLLLLGDDKSYESGVVMSAIVTRALQATQVPPPPQPRRVDARCLLFGALPQSVVELLGGGPAAQSLVASAHAGDRRSLVLLGHLLSRLSPQQAVAGDCGTSTSSSTYSESPSPAG